MLNTIAKMITKAAIKPIFFIEPPTKITIIAGRDCLTVELINL